MPSDVTGPAIIEYVRYDLPTSRRRGHLRACRRHPGRVSPLPRLGAQALGRGTRALRRSDRVGLAGRARPRLPGVGAVPDLLRGTVRLRRVPPGDGPFRASKKSALSCRKSVTAERTSFHRRRGHRRRRRLPRPSRGPVPVTGPVPPTTPGRSRGRYQAHQGTRTPRTPRGPRRPPHQSSTRAAPQCDIAVALGTAM
jgi:hypothetical protein